MERPNGKDSPYGALKEENETVVQGVSTTTLSPKSDQNKNGYMEPI